MGQIADLQKIVWANKVAKGFDKTGVDREFNYIYGEVAEAYDAYGKAKDTVGDELADVVIYIMGLAEMLGLNLEEDILAKISVNEKRKYREVNGHFIKEAE